MNTSDISSKLQTPDKAAHTKNNNNKKLADGSIEIADESQSPTSPDVMGPLSPPSDVSFNSNLPPESDGVEEVDHLVLTDPHKHSPDSTAAAQVKKIKQVANAESPVLKSQEIFGAVKVKDGLFLGDQYSAQVRKSRSHLHLPFCYWLMAQ